MFAIWVVNDQFNAGFLNVLSQGVLAPLTRLEQCPPIQAFSWPEPLPITAFGELLGEIAALPWEDANAWWRFFVINPSQGERIVVLQSRAHLNIAAICGLIELLGSSSALGLPLGLESNHSSALAHESCLKAALDAEGGRYATQPSQAAYALPETFSLSELEAVAELFAIEPLSVVCMSLQVAFFRLLAQQESQLKFPIRMGHTVFELDSQECNPLRWWLSQNRQSLICPESDVAVIKTRFLCCGEVSAFALVASDEMLADSPSLTLTVVQVENTFVVSLSAPADKTALAHALALELPDAFEQLLFAAFSMGGMGHLDTAAMLNLMDQGLPTVEGLMDALISKHYAPEMQRKAHALTVQLEALNQRLDQSSEDKKA